MRKLIAVTLFAAFVFAISTTTFAQDALQGRPNSTTSKSEVAAPEQNQNLAGYRELNIVTGKPHVFGVGVGTKSWQIASLNAYSGSQGDPNLPRATSNRIVFEPVLTEGESLTEATLGFSGLFGTLYGGATQISVFDKATGELLAELYPNFEGTILGYTRPGTSVYWGNNTMPANILRGIPFPWMYIAEHYHYSWVFRVKLPEPGNVQIEVRWRTGSGALQIAAGGFSDLNPKPPRI